MMYSILNAPQQFFVPLLTILLDIPAEEFAPELMWFGAAEQQELRGKRVQIHHSSLSPREET